MGPHLTWSMQWGFTEQPNLRCHWWIMINYNSLVYNFICCLSPYIDQWIIVPLIPIHDIAVSISKHNPTSIRGCMDSCISTSTTYSYLWYWCINFENIILTFSGGIIHGEEGGMTMKTLDYSYKWSVISSSCWIVDMDRHIGIFIMDHVTGI